MRGLSFTILLSILLVSSGLAQGTITCACMRKSALSRVYIECRGFKSHPRQLFFPRKSDCLGCAVLLCLVVYLTLLASFFLPSHLSLNMQMYICINMYVHVHVCHDCTFDKYSHFSPSRSVH